MLFCYSTGICKESATTRNHLQVGSLNVFTSPDLYPLTAKWISEYSKTNPAEKIELVTTGELDISAILKSKPGLGFIRDESFSTMKNAPLWNMVVGRNIIVPIMNRNNPLKDELDKKGITTDGFLRLLTTNEKQNWTNLIENPTGKTKNPVHFYFVNDPVITSGIASFAGLKEFKLNGIPVATEQHMIAAIQNDPYGIGFCKLNNVSNQLNQGNSSVIKLVPIDKNKNGKIDYSEAIYDNLQEFTRGVWIGKYPVSLSGKIYTVSSAKPKNEAEISFLNWILTDGQQYLNTSGYSDLVSNERQSQLSKINEPSAYSEIRTARNPILMIKFLIVLALLAMALVVDLVIRRSKNKKRVVANATPANLLNVINQAATVIPKGLYFDKTHTWAYMKKNGLVKLGIDDFMQHVTGPLTRVEMKKCGEKIKKGEHLVTIIQKGKQLNIYSPVTGTISAQNKNLITNAGLLNAAPFTDGWVYIIEPTNWSLEIQFMNMAEKYANWLTSEYSRLRDFFASAVRVHVPAFVTILQDGGVLRDGILAELSPEVWEDFQTKFIDPTR